MNDIRVRSIIENLYNQILHPAYGMLKLWDQKPEVGMYFTFKITHQNHGYKKDGNTFVEGWERLYDRFVHIIITARHRVYVCVSHEPQSSKIKPEDYKNTSNHDSEWRGGLEVIEDLNRDGWKYCWDWMPEEHRPVNMYYPQAHTHLGRGFLGTEIINFVQVERGPHPDKEERERGYLDTLTKVTPIKFNITLEV